MLNKIHNMDCVDGMRQLPECSIDLTVTSPPYDNLRVYNGFSFDFQQVAKELYRVTKPGGVVVWVVNDGTVNGSETGTSFRQALFFMECGFNLHDTMIYAKHNPPPTGGKNRYFQSFEYMFIFSKGTPKTFNPLTEPRRNICNDKRTHRNKSFTRNAAGEFERKEVAINQDDPKRRNVWTYLVGGGNTTDDKIAYQHPAIFPEALAGDHIESWSNPGDVVLDPFMGSGTTAKMAITKGRIFVGFEVSADYCEICRERIAHLKEHDGMTEEDAFKFVEHNVLRDVAHMGSNSPIVLYGMDEITDMSDAPEDIKAEIIANDERLRKKGMEEKKC